MKRILSFVLVFVFIISVSAESNYNNVESKGFCENLGENITEDEDISAIIRFNYEPIRSEAAFSNYLNTNVVGKYTNYTGEMQYFTFNVYMNTSKVGIYDEFLAFTYHTYY